MIIKAQAIVLRVNKVGENHRGLSMLVSGKGLINPLAYGATSRKSALRSSALPYNRGLAELSYDGSRRRWRLRSFDPVETHDGLRENLERFYTASIWAEILLRSYGSGEDSASIFILVANALSLLSRCMPQQITRLNCAFLWNFLKIEGVRPDLDKCSKCSRNLESGAIYFLPNGLLICPYCGGSNMDKLSPGAIRWLLVISDMEINRAISIGLSSRCTAAIERWLIVIVQVLLERPLESLRERQEAGLH